MTRKIHILTQLTLIIIFISQVTFEVQAQHSPDSIKHLLEAYTNKFHGEKIYIHTDKPYYYLNDTIWFKVYITDAAFHLPDTLSKIIYVDLVRKDNGKIIFHKLLKNESGFANSEMVLQDSLKTGSYELVGFTNWMKNFPDNFFFREEIKIYKLGGLNQDILSTERLNEVADLQFFPEGGNLIAGLQNRVAFKAINRAGRGVDFKAHIISDHKDTVATIASQHLGMGSFVFNPKAEEKYSVIIEKFPEANQFHLPPTSSNGYTFFVDNLSNDDLIKVNARNNFTHMDRPILIGHQRGEIVFALQSEMPGNSFAWTLPKKELKENGVVQLTLFNAQGIPQCERLLYNQIEPNLQISITSDKTEYRPREKVKLSIHVKDQDDYAVEGNFSLSITDTHQVVPEINGENIYSYLYLTSDVEELIRGEIKGVIEQPYYYFNQSNPNAAVHLDILLMTQGWRRFLWRKLFNQKNIAPKYTIERGITLLGKAVLPKRKPLPEPVELTLLYSPKQETSVSLKTKTDATGRFLVSNIDAYNHTKISLRTPIENKNRNYILSFDQPELPFYLPATGLSDTFLSSEEFNLFRQQQQHLEEIETKKTKNNTVLKELVVTAKREKKEDPRKVMYEGTNFTSVVIDQQMCASAFSVIQLLQGRVAGLQIVQDSTGNYVATMRGPRSFLGHTYPAVLVDGMVTDMRYLNALPPCSIESIDVITHPVASLNAQGLISVLTKGASNGYKDWSVPESAKGNLVAIVQGYDIPKEFYSPKYSSADKQNQTPDFRSTLYWNPAVKTDADGKAEVVFWNSDEITSFRVGIEGISTGGKPGYATYNYSVK